MQDLGRKLMNRLNLNGCARPWVFTLMLLWAAIGLCLGPAATAAWAGGILAAPYSLPDGSVISNQ
jgi:hypothetical protein